MKILIDMNLTPDWVEEFKSYQIESHHWSKIGEANARDSEIVHYAKTNGFIIFTHDLDFGAILAISNAKGPSVIQLRTQNVMPGAASELIVKHLEKYQDQLETGALIIIDENKSRIRILPLRT